jgi:adenosylcobinamide kinase/adenosylcobinamide-phosphate guanylyltransferase
MSTLTTTLVLGGARSGKSSFATRMVRESGLERIFIATATPSDDEMQARIARHRSDRGDGWRTIEEPLAIADTLMREGKADRVILVDCLTLWLNNLMWAKRDIERETTALANAVRVSVAPIVLVSNEVGLGIHPHTDLGRRFCDAQGRLNQTIAAIVPNVALIAAGLPLWLKRMAL